MYRTDSQQNILLNNYFHKTRPHIVYTILESSIEGSWQDISFDMYWT